MSVYSTRFFRGSLPANSLDLLYTVPATMTVVLRDMEVLVAAANDLINVQIGTSGGTTVVWYLSAQPASSWHQWQGRTVLNSGESLYGYSGSGAAQLVISGYLLSP